MDFTRQIIELLSEPPGSFIYHIITLFALQVVFAISYSRWRRQREDEYARNMSWAAGAIFLGRLILLIAGLSLSRNPAAAASILPPLEQAINTASILLLVWALIPSMARHPRALDILLIILLVLTGVMYLFFAQEWQNQIASGETAFHGTTQASIWTMMQIAALAIGFGYLLFYGRSLGALPPIIIGVLLVCTVIHLWNYPEFVPTDTNVAYWIRLGNLIAIPLWAVYAYTYAMTPLLESESKFQDSVEKFGGSLEQAAQVIATQQPPRRIAYSLQMANQMFDTSFSAIGLIDPEDNDIVDFHVMLPDQSPGEITNQELALSEHATLVTALGQDGSTQLLRSGLGSRQLYGFFEAVDIEPSSSLLVCPLGSNGDKIGILVLPAPGDADHWPEEAQNLVPGLAHFVTQALLNSQVQPPAEEPEPLPLLPPASTAVPAAIIMDRVRVQDLEQQLASLREDLSEAEKKRRHAEANAAAAQKQARYLAGALRTVQSFPESARPVDTPLPDPDQQDNTVSDSDPSV